MCPISDDHVPAEHRETASETSTESAQEDPVWVGDELPVQTATLGNGWLLMGIFLLLAVGVLMLLIFASGGNADSSMML